MPHTRKILTALPDEPPADIIAVLTDLIFKKAEGAVRPDALTQLPAFRAAIQGAVHTGFLLGAEHVKRKSLALCEKAIDQAQHKPHGLPVLESPENGLRLLRNRLTELSVVLPAQDGGNGPTS